MIKLNKILIGFCILILMSSVSFAVETTQWDECLSKFNGDKDECIKYCMGDKDEIVCNYPSENWRYFIQRLYPVECENALKKWNETENVNFFFMASPNAKSGRDDDIVCGNFEKDQRDFGYQLPVHFANFVELNKQLWVDYYGAPYFVKPSYSELKNIYQNVLGTNEIRELEDNLQVKDSVKNTINVMKYSYDCDYTGEGDNEWDSINQGENLIDFTESTRFLNDASITTWGDVIEEMKDSNLDRFRSLYVEHSIGSWTYYVPSLINYLSVEFDEYIVALFKDESSRVWNDYTNELDYSFYYSNQESVSNVITCNYPKSVYGNENVTLKIEVTYGKTLESLLSGFGSEFTWSDVGLGCSDGSPICHDVLEYTFFLNETSGEISFVSSESTQLNFSNFEDAVNHVNQQITNVVYPLLGEDFEEPVREDIPQTVFEDKNLNKVIDWMIELAEYVISIIILAGYFIQFWLLSLAFVLGINSFKNMRNSIYDLLELKRGKK